MISIDSITTASGDDVQGAINSQNYEFDILIRISYETGGTDDYYARLISLEALAQSVYSAPRVGRGMIIMKTFNAVALTQLIEQIVAKCDSGNAISSTERLRRYFMHEGDEHWIFVE